MCIELGMEVKDKVSGLIGIAASRVEYLNGCVQFGVRGKVKKDGTPPDAFYIDQEQLEVVGKGLTVAKKQTGGDMVDRPQR